MGVSSGMYINRKNMHTLSISLQGLNNHTPKIMQRALNRTLDFTYTATIREVRDIYAIKRTDVAKTMIKHKASRSGLLAYIRSRGRLIALGNFPHNPSVYKPGNKIIKVKVKKSEGFKAIDAQDGTPKPFVQSIYSYESLQSGIYQRKDSRKFPVVSLRSISVPQMIGNEGVLNVIEKSASEKLQERINHELEWELTQIQKKLKG